MPSVEVTDDLAVPAGPQRAAGDDAPARHRSRPALMVAGIVLVAAAAYSVLALQSPIPSIAPDEYFYSQLVRGLAHGTGFAWRGEPLHQTAALYIYFIAPVWAAVSSFVDAYNASRVLGTVALCMQAFPVWLLARELVRPRLAVLAAALSLAGTWMLASSALATETLAMPLATTALCLTVLSLRRPSLRLDLLAVGFALLASWARIQLVVLGAAIVAAFALNALRAPRGRRRAALGEHRLVLAAGAAVVLVGLVAVLVHPALVGGYSEVIDYRPSLGATVKKLGLQLLELGAATAFLPLLLAAAAIASPRAWADDRSGPLLIVIWTAAVALALQSGFFIAGLGSIPTGIERYVSYVAPLLLVLLLVLLEQRELLSTRSYALAAVLALAYLLMPEPLQVGIEPAGWSLRHRLGDLLSLGTATTLTLVAVATVAVAWATTRRLRAVAATAAVAGMVLLVFAVQDETSWQRLIQVTRNFRAQALPADLEWLDHHSHGDVALIASGINPPQIAIEEFFNRSISRFYIPEGTTLQGRPVDGRTCAYHVDGQTGELRFDPGCPPATNRFYLHDPNAALTFADVRRTAWNPRAGRIVELAPGATPRLRALVEVPCPMFTWPGDSTTSWDTTPPPTDCRPGIRGQVWLDRPGRLEFRFAGGAAPHAVATEAAETRDIPPRRPTTVSIPAGAGSSAFAMSFDWSSSKPGMPRLLSAAIVEGGKRTPITY
ncbi:MAG TPA: hypothetical protein VFT50_07600 [Baekduia sp.]|nr:hypothetical protein [Baekduia sp.]